MGVPPIPRKALSEESFTVALAQLVEDSKLHQEAAALGSLIRQESGLENALERIEKTLEDEHKE